ncbi:MAG: SUMF1/EgtB/PvdO family nonheme iron enzyme [Thermoguttaceae bacterium]|nr:SUMF1/EgtB/PvdO family nonheme iron enzyme [Thermoguttaceae bacterium]
MAQYELTFRSFQSFVNATHYETTANRKDSALVFQKGAWHIAAGYHWQRPGFKQRDHMPVVCVSHEDAEAFIAWLNQATSDELHRNFGPNARYALPTEAQWKYTFHTESEHKTSFVDKPSEIVKYGNLPDQRAITEIDIPPGNIHSDNISSEYIFIYTASVGRFAPSPWGIYDLHGNVREWCTSGHEPSQGVACGSGWSDTVAAACGGVRSPKRRHTVKRMSVFDW